MPLLRLARVVLELMDHEEPLASAGLLTLAFKASGVPTHIHSENILPFPLPLGETDVKMSDEYLNVQSESLTRVFGWLHRPASSLPWAPWP